MSAAHYLIQRHAFNEVSAARVEDGRETPLEPASHDSPSGFDYGTARLGTGDLALAILCAHLDIDAAGFARTFRDVRHELPEPEATAWKWHHIFKKRFLASVDRDAPLKIPLDSVEAFLAECKVDDDRGSGS